MAVRRGPILGLVEGKGETAMATKYQRGRQWWGRVQRDGHDIRKPLGTTSRSLADRYLKLWLDRLDAEAWGEKPRKSYRDTMESFIDNHLPRLRPTTRARYMVSAKLLHPHFNGKFLDEITSARLSEFEMARRKQGARSPTIRRDLLCLSSMFTHAIVDLEWTQSNPISPYLSVQRRRGRLKESPPRTRYLTHDEEAALLVAADYELAGQMAFAIDTGLRKSEQWSLTWPQIQGGYKEVWIPAEKAKGGRERRVPLLPRSAQFLAQLPRHLRRGDEPDWVFRKANGERYGERRKAFLAAIERAGLNELIWHDLRRTCGCRLLQDHGMEMKKVADWLGHKSVTVTERSYAFLSVENLHTAIRDRHDSRHRSAGQEIDE
jgi:integrase